MADRPEEPAGRAHLRLVRGDASPEEIAALVAVLAARAASGPPVVRARSTWADPALAMRGRLTAGPGAWSRSARTAGQRFPAGS
ncbi:Acyl-CoA carboxylase epsilon subunit [Parafrankia irregularis]|uniref:Acyl-CoA carboxylase epsilon subunit n=1 Tax=Parafrankia irregularis TaxID=795642 RepID=A0A0S4QFP3_9ACTN|nr:MULTISPECIES: acyl-CoA carboxylase epsilon subunit [Parafrankia]MBE3202913.1 acyl-CoA carboxylase subunit epsilon [Parafrankia sp. CH37]CUU54459.1 Acyl-CoA carboxylase epsilon subunit [Parafrankia irregularis]